MTQPLARLVIDLDPSQLKGLDDVLALKPEVVKRALRLVGGHYMTIQRGRIKLGQKPGGGSFREYSEDYGEKKERAGRDSGTETGWLRLTGRMLKSQKTKLRNEGKGAAMVIEFDGNHPQTYFKSRRQVRKGKKLPTPGGDLVVRLGTGRMSMNAAIAERVDRDRPFIGVSAKEAGQLAEVFITELAKDLVGKKLSSAGASTFSVG